MRVALTATFVPLHRVADAAPSPNLFRRAEILDIEAQEIGYQRMRLDSIASLKVAATLYRSLGFIDIPPYGHNLLLDPVFMELVL